MSKLKLKPIAITAKAVSVTESSDRRDLKTRAYGNSQLMDVINDWFNENELYAIRFKSKTWSRLFKQISKIEGVAIAKSLTELTHCNVLGINFSRKAGCSCGCSPGYLVKGLLGKSYWFEYETEAWAIEEVKAILPEYTKLLKEEIAAHELANRR